MGRGQKMCDRICPACGSRNHFEQYGICGMTLYCDQCLIPLAHRFDAEAAPTDLSYDEAEEYAKARSGILPGAEAADPADDEIYRGTFFISPTPSPTTDPVSNEDEKE